MLEQAAQKCQSLVSHAKLAFVIAPDEEVRCLLGPAIEKYQKGREFEE